MGVAKSLRRSLGDSQTVSLHGGKAGQAGRQTKVCRGKIAEAVNPAVIHCEDGFQGNIVEIRPEFCTVAADRPGEVVGKLVALFRPLYVGVGFATYISEARDVYSYIASARCGGVVKVGKAAPGILKAKLIDAIVADGPRILKHAGDITIGLLRSSRICILPEHLVFAVDLDSGYGAGTHICAQRDAIVVTDVVIQAQRIETRAFKNREVSGLRVERLKSRWKPIAEQVRGREIRGINVAGGKKLLQRIAV